MVVVWRVTEQCNLACGFCGFDRTLNRVRVETSVESLRRFGAVLRDWSLASGESVLVSWIGGEPLGRDDLRAVSRHFREDLGLRVSTTTNGTTLGSAAVRSHLLDHYAELTVSVDGVGPLHDRLRGWPGGFENLSLSVPILAREAREREAPLRLRANVVLMRDNLEQFEDLCSILGDWGVVEITFNQLGGADRPEFFPEHRLREAEVDRLRVIIPRVRDSLARREVAAPRRRGIPRTVRRDGPGRPPLRDRLPPGRVVPLYRRARAGCSMQLHPRIDRRSDRRAGLRGGHDEPESTLWAVPGTGGIGVRQLPEHPGLPEVRGVDGAGRTGARGADAQTGRHAA
ncbi:MAG: radical SAM protein [Candidatus Eisenbacteria bacterium]|nr:radical SAM protein [Candidatus Eisenbacteria bacterium]